MKAERALAESFPEIKRAKGTRCERGWVRVKERERVRVKERERGGVKSAKRRRYRFPSLLRRLN